jgi:hypothetical protein
MRYTVKKDGSGFYVCDSTTGESVYGAERYTRDKARAEAKTLNDGDHEDDSTPVESEISAKVVETPEEFSNPRNAWANFTAAAQSATTEAGRNYWQAKADAAYLQSEAER